ncbi:MAG: GGDEF domain-containing protein [Rhodospirillales bacterium]|nr:GGDEF domain-containing protein [Rhodospirillales bacterium]
MTDSAIKEKPTSLETAALHESAMLARRFVALAFCRADLLFELDNEQSIKFVAGATPSLFGKNTPQMMGIGFLDLVHEEDKSTVSELLHAAGDKGRFDDVSIRLKTIKSDASLATIAGYRVPDFDNNFFLVIKIASNQQARTEPVDPLPPGVEALLPASGGPAVGHDDEAGILDNKAYATVAAKRLKEASGSGAHAKLTMVKIDNLDELKRDLSDQDQDKLMTTIGGILSSQSLGGDTAGRINDENFSFAHTDDIDIKSVGQKIENAAREIAPNGVGIGAVATSLDADGNDLTEEQLAKAISYAMQSFSSGKRPPDPATIAHVFETMMAETMKNIESFKRICATRAFDLVYMPICDLKTGALHHYEALTRFRGTKEESPFKLITMAEEIGLISEFDITVAQKAVNFINKQAASGGSHTIAVNVSGHSIQDDKFVGELHGLLKRATNLSRMLMFEITESSGIEDLEAVNATIQQFRTKGFKFALDDFGAGAAGFDYLNTFDIDTVKFDGPVVKRAYATEKGKAFLKSMATLCNDTGIETIAEMVEDKELADFLLTCGVHLGQGWYFGKPMPESEMSRR